MNLQVKLFLKQDLLMEKVCQDWSKEAFDSKLVNASYWDEFAQNAKMASAEIIRVANMASAAREFVLPHGRARAQTWRCRSPSPHGPQQFLRVCGRRSSTT